MKNFFYLVMFLCAIFSAVRCHPFEKKEFMFSQKSPDGNYEVKVYTFKRLLASPGDGGTYSRTAYVILLDKDGNEIGNSGEDPSSFGDIEIDWQIGSGKYVSYGRGHSIDFKK